MQKIALISIKPNFANKILFGEKRYEYRKVPISQDTTHILLYMTAPVMKVVGTVRVKKIHEGAPSTIWEQTKKESGITRAFYREYFAGKKKAFAIELGEVTPLSYWIDPKTIDPNFRAPQSFQYVDNNFYNAIFDDNMEKESISHILFFGGIHGVGKSTFCDRLKKDIGIDTVSASYLIKTEKLLAEQKDSDKRVQDIANNQNLLLMALKKKSLSGDFILDGHFCLLNKDGVIERIPQNTFKQINPRELFLLETRPEDIVKNLKQRDGVNYDIQLIKEMLREERAYAEYISKTLNRPLSVIQHTDYIKTRDEIQNSMLIYLDK